MRKLDLYFQGDHGAFSEEAGLRYFNFNVNPVPCKEFEDVVKKTINDKNSYGILPIENTSIGSIHSNYDLLLKYRIYIVGEINLIVKHHLIGIRNTDLSKIKRIISHPAAIQQCQKFLKSLRKVDIEIAYDTAGSVKFIKENNLFDTAAISSEISAKIYSMRILKKNIQDTNSNITRFLILSRKKVIPKNNPKTSIVFTLLNKPGSLFRALSVFALRDIDLKKIESRPIPEKPFEYYFYLDFKGSMMDKVSQNAIKNLKEISSFLKILGSYQEDTNNR